MPAAIAPIAGAVVGGLMSDGGGGGQQTASKEPWGPAQQPLKDTLEEARRLQLYQQQNPWNVLQQTGYQNAFTDLDAFRQQNNGLMQMANRLMGANYQRGQAPTGGLLSQQAQPQRQAGLLGNVFSIPQGQSYGMLDFQQLNPYTATNGIQAMPKPMADEKTIQQLVQEEMDRRAAAQVDPYYWGG